VKKLVSRLNRKARTQKRPASLRKGKTQQVKANAKSHFRDLTLAQDQNLQVLVNQGKLPADIYAKIHNNIPLTDTEMGVLQGAMNALGPKQGNFKLAIGAAIAQATAVRNQVAAMNSLASACGGSCGPCPGITGPDGDTLMPPCEAASFPTDPDDPDSPCATVGVSCGDDDPANQPDDPAYQEVVANDSSGQALNTDFRVRTLRLVNPTDKQVVVYLNYHTFTDSGEEDWFPGEPDGTEANALRVELEPGQASYVEEDGWRVNADRIRIWTDDWTTFKDKDMILVPEPGGVYKAAAVETVTVAVP
jgi:hypothetical protein